MRDNSCTTRKEDWNRFVAALLEVLHTGKNLVVEELRRWGLTIRGVNCGDK